MKKKLIEMMMPLEAINKLVFFITLPGCAGRSQTAIRSECAEKMNEASDV